MTSSQQVLSLGCLLALLPTAVHAQAASQTVAYPAPSAVQSIAARPITSFGDEAMDYNGVVSIVVLGSGNVVVANAGSRQLRFFDRTGRLVREVGRRGGGPGEYQDISGVSALPHDSLLVWDGRARRVTVLDPNGDYVRTFPLEPPFDGVGAVTRVVALPSGNVLVGFSEVIRLAPSPNAQRFGERLVQFTSDGQRHGRAELRLASSDHFVQAVPPERGGVAYWALAFGRSLTVRATATGIATGDGTSWQLETRNLSAFNVTSRHQVNRSPAPVTAAAVKAYRDRELQGESGPGRLITERMLNQMPFPKTQPAFSRFEVDERGRFWIEDYTERRSSAPVWMRLDPETRRTIAVRFPARFQPLAFANETAIGVLRDEDDVERVVAFDLRTLR